MLHDLLGHRSKIDWHVVLWVFFFLFLKLGDHTFSFQSGFSETILWLLRSSPCFSSLYQHLMKTIPCLEIQLAQIHEVSVKYFQTFMATLLMPVPKGDEFFLNCVQALGTLFYQECPEWSIFPEFWLFLLLHQYGYIMRHVFLRMTFSETSFFFSCQFLTWEWA